MISEYKESKEKEILNNALSALGNVTRIHIARYIRKNEEVKFGNIRYEFNLNNNSLTFHLKKLERSHIISKPKEGTYTLGILGEPMLHILDKFEEDVYQFLESNPNHLSN